MNNQIGVSPANSALGTADNPAVSFDAITDILKDFTEKREDTPEYIVIGLHQAYQLLKLQGLTAKEAEERVNKLLGLYGNESGALIRIASDLPLEPIKKKPSKSQLKRYLSMSGHYSGGKR